MSRQQAENEAERGRLQSLIAKLEAHVAHQSRQIEQVRRSCMCGSMECLSLAIVAFHRCQVLLILPFQYWNNSCAIDQYHCVIGIYSIYP